uniref:Uncharacterized protein n=1 Tax=viral metagenome TaxID=1070528 RepID=A0A6M3L1L4_9ZZZZ
MQNNEQTSVRVSKENRKRLNKIAGDIKSRTGEMATANDAIDYLFEMLDKQEAQK